MPKFTRQDWLKLGGTIPAAVGGEGEVTIVLERPDGAPVTPEEAADVALGIDLRSYTFDKYKTKKKKDDEAPQAAPLRPCRRRSAKAAEQAWSVGSAVADGVAFARDLVNEPANALGPVEFADRLKGLTEARRRREGARRAGAAAS